MRSGLVAVVMALVFASVAAADDLRTAEQLAWDKRFAESEAMYRRLPASDAARLGLARVVMWQGRYAEAIALFRELRGVDALEGQATAEYWSGDLRAAARDCRRVLALDPRREEARKSLAEIVATTRPSQRLFVGGSQDDQPLDAVRAELSSTFFSDPQTRWTAAVGGYQLDAGRIGERDGEYALIANETIVGKLTFGASLGAFHFPDDAWRPIGGVSVRYRSLTLRIDRREEIASATSLRTHAASTTTTLRWSRDRDWIAAAEISDRRYFDDNAARAAIAYAVMPRKFGAWTLWSGASAAVRDSEESRFRITAVSSTLEQGAFRYAYRGEYDPYWTPDNLVEARAVVALERRASRFGVKFHADGGFARDRGRAFGPDLGTTPLPAQTFTFAFDRSYRPWRAGVTADVAIAPALRLEAGIERSTTVDYRSTAFHASLVRRR